MTLPAVLAPVFAQALLTFVLLFWMGGVRTKAVRAKAVEVRPGSQRNYGWPAKAQQVSDAYHNQFELPVLFFALVPLVIITRKADFLFVLLAWVFVVLRWLHAFEHTSKNRLRIRFGLFAAGAIVLLIMWAVFAVRILLAAEI
ncbi:MAPEG family protein [Hansschlegelia quercus]|uniref:MAPEG family protein n=1 Tax=Hansschlegelia quercus TaxID=2528245 RepID=A0A4Q9GJ05_9HYPH|nr:MAPEG family protein [Hansschlegelia quercus]TBN54213.1 MAPEG family protein [Hansschlegelia quercus]